jgi:hypothetical protein
MLELVYTLILLAVINFYLIVRMRRALSGAQKFIISLISISILYFVFSSAFFFSSSLEKINPGTPVFYITFAVLMNLMLPIITTEIALALYMRYSRQK